MRRVRWASHVHHFVSCMLRVLRCHYQPLAELLLPTLSKHSLIAKTSTKTHLYTSTQHKPFRLLLLHRMTRYLPSRSASQPLNVLPIGQFGQQYFCLVHSSCTALFPTDESTANLTKTKTQKSSVSSPMLLPQNIYFKIFQMSVSVLRWHYNGD